MSEEDLNQELSTDDLKDVAGGFLSGCGKAQAKGYRRKTDSIVGQANGAKSRKGKKFVDTDTGIVHLEDDAIQA
tara:strand:+ start:139 stop:360 length:222 start_codon:yes stop_codon:yes gene_type:complete